MFYFHTKFFASSVQDGRGRGVISDGNVHQHPTDGEPPHSNRAVTQASQYYARSASCFL